MQYFPDKQEIVLDREVSVLDRFVIDFVRVLEKFADYVIISGYVSILFGRARATEDVDIFIRRISKEKFTELFSAIDKAGFACINSDNVASMFSYLDEGLAIRFARKGEVIPNIELKFVKKKLDEDTFDDPITVLLGKEKLIISSLERQIAFKRYFLKSDKDVEDALHIEEVFKGQIGFGKIKELKEAIERL